MKGKPIGDFISELYYNAEIEFLYKDERYMISGYIENCKYTLEVFCITQDKSIFNVSDDKRERCIEKFEETKIFDGKTIYEVEKDITVLYG